MSIDRFKRKPYRWRQFRPDNRMDQNFSFARSRRVPRGLRCSITDLSAGRATMGFQENYKTYLKSEHWQKLKNAKLAETGGICFACSGTKLPQIHHLKYDDLYAITLADLIVLCKWCHKFFHDFAKEQNRKATDFSADEIKAIIAAAGRNNSEKENALKEAIRLADESPLPDRVKVYESPNIQRLLAVCWHLSEAGKSPFFLSCESAKNITKTHDKFWASSFLSGFVRDGILELVSKGKVGQASRYRFLE